MSVPVRSLLLCALLFGLATPASAQRGRTDEGRCVQRFEQCSKACSSSHARATARVMNSAPPPGLVGPVGTQSTLQWQGRLDRLGARLGQCLDACSEKSDRCEEALRDEIESRNDNLGFDDGAAAYNAGDYATARRAFEAEAQRGNARGQFFLGQMHELGRGVPQDYAQAAQWYRQAAEQGYTSAQINLGVLYWNGQGVRQDKAEAVQWYRKAAGHPNAQFNLGMAYSHGEGVEKNLAEGMGWFRKAAEQRLAAAQHALGVMYANGEGAPQDFVEALKWLLVAKANGHSDAAAAITNVQARMQPGQIAQAQALASGWLNAHR